MFCYYGNASNHTYHIYVAGCDQCLLLVHGWLCVYLKCIKSIYLRKSIWMNLPTKYGTICIYMFPQ